MHRLIDYADALKQTAYGFFGLSVTTGTATWKFAPQMQFMNENAPVIGLGFSFVFGLAGVGFAIANYRINVKRLKANTKKVP